MIPMLTKKKKPLAPVALAHAFEAYTPPGPDDQVGILFFNLGGPDDQESVQPFLRNLFRDNDIIQLPFPQWAQEIFAWRVSRKRGHEARENYGKIGGGSPILKLTQMQIDLTREKLTPEFEAQGLKAPKTYLAMRYWHPFCEEALADIQKDGITHLILLPLYPHYSLATIGSSYREWGELMNGPWSRLAKTLQVSTLCSYYKEPKFLQAIANTMNTAIEANEWGCDRDTIRMVFSAHGIPVKYAAKNKDPYPRQIKMSCELIMEQFFPNNPWDLCWQSRVGPLEWLQPYTEDFMPELGKKGVDNVLMVPISFVTDHIETLFEMDMLYVQDGLDNGMKYCARAMALNDEPVFIELLADLVMRNLNMPSQCKIDLSKIGEFKPGEFHCSSINDYTPARWESIMEKR